MNSLFQINTVYQLFITINMRLHNIPEGDVDIAVSDHTPALKNYIPGLQESGLFRNVYYIQSLEFNNYFWGIPNEGKPKIFKDYSVQLKRVTSEPEIHYQVYDNLFVANLDVHTKFLHCEFPNMNIFQIEDGAATCSTDWKTISARWNYIEGFNAIYDDVKGLYLYSPEFVSFNYPAPLIQLPKVSHDQKTIETYNKIFNYTPISFPKFIFVEQSFQVDNIKNNDLDFISATFDIVGYDNLYIKPHPRNQVHRPFSYGLSRVENDSVPFELMLLNDCRQDSVYITVDSGALISTRVIFDDDVKTIFLYKAITGKTHMHGGDAFSAYMDRFSERYASRNLMVPGSLEEYRCMLKHIK